MKYALDASEKEVESIFGCYADIANRLIRERRQRVANHLETDWSVTFEIGRKYPITENQLAFLMSLLEESKIFHMSRDEMDRLSKTGATIMIDWLLLEQEIERILHRKERQMQKGDVKLTMTTIDKLRKQYEKVANLWNEILADDVITQEECIKLHDTIKRYRIYPNDFEEFLTYIENQALKDGRIDNREANKLYDYVVDILNVMKTRINTKIEQENAALSQEG